MSSVPIIAFISSWGSIMKRKISKSILLGVIGLILLLTPIVINVQSSRYITNASGLKNEYRQNETLEVVGVIFNNDSTVMQVLSFNVIVKAAVVHGGGNATVYVNITKDINQDIEQHQAYTAFVKIPLKNLLPDSYNVTAFFKIKYYGEDEETVYVIENTQIRVRPYIEIPPFAMVVLMLMIGVIIVFIGYGIAGRFSKKKS